MYKTSYKNCNKNGQNAPRDTSQWVHDDRKAQEKMDNVTSYQANVK